MNLDEQNVEMTRDFTPKVLYTLSTYKLTREMLRHLQGTFTVLTANKSRPIKKMYYLTPTEIEDRSGPRKSKFAGLFIAMDIAELKSRYVLMMPKIQYLAYFM